MPGARPARARARNWGHGSWTKHLIGRLSVVVAGSVLAALGADISANAAVNVTEHHNHDSRDGLYVDPAFTSVAAAGLKRDLTFTGNIKGNVYAQPLYIEGGPGGKAMIIAVTESNNVYALDAANGSVIWQCNVGAPVPLSKLLCGNVDPLGITGTPVVDLPSRSLFFDAMTTPDGGTTKRHLIYALNVDTGTTNSGWLVGVPLNNPVNIMAWATTANGGGSWGVGGVASDGANPFLVTGNTFGATGWSGGEAIIRFQIGPVFSGVTDDYWAPANWSSLDSSDLDIGGSGALLVDVPGATPSKLVVSLGKDGNAYLLDRTHLGGIRAPLAQAHVSSSSIIQAAATYRTTLGTYVVFCGNGSQLSAFRITATAPPTITSVWTVAQNGKGSPFVTSTDGTNNVIVWGIGSENDQRLHGFNGDTGAVVFSGGGANELMAGTRRFNTGIAARGRIYLANDNKVYAFTVPVAPILLTHPKMQPGDAFQFGFTNTPGMSFTAFGSTNASVRFTNWIKLGSVMESSPGQFQFTDAPGSTSWQRFYRVSSP